MNLLKTQAARVNSAEAATPGRCNRCAPAEFDAYLLELIEQLAERPEVHINYLRHGSFYDQSSVYSALCRHAAADTQRILELGSGHGLLSVALARAGYDVCATDFYLGETKGLAEQAGQASRVQYLERNLEENDYNLERGGFDAVVSVGVVEHLKNVRSFFRNAQACLRPGGLFLVLTPNYARLNTRLRAVKNIFSPKWPTQFHSYVTDEPYVGHLREFTPAELRQAFELYGFEVLDQSFPSCIGAGRLPNRLRNCHPIVALGVRFSIIMSNALSTCCPSLGFGQLVVGRKPFEEASTARAA